VRIALFPGYISEGYGPGSSHAIDYGEGMGTQFFLFNDGLHGPGLDITAPSGSCLDDEFYGFRTIGVKFLGKRFAREKKQNYECHEERYE
jgi:hypothetical protein